MTSYGKIYCISSIGPMLPAYFAGAFGETEKEDLIKKTYYNGIRMFKMLQGREPDKLEHDSTYKAAKEYVNRLLEKPTTRATNHLLEITHPLLSIENMVPIAKGMSQRFKDTALCTVSNFDESVFQLSVIKNGTPLTVHQIGDALSQMNMETKRGDVGIIASFFNIPFSAASEFIGICDPMDAADLFFRTIVP